MSRELLHMAKAADESYLKLRSFIGVMHPLNPKGSSYQKPGAVTNKNADFILESAFFLFAKKGVRLICFAVSYAIGRKPRLTLLCRMVFRVLCCGGDKRVLKSFYALLFDCC